MPPTLKGVLKRLRSLATFYIAEQTLGHLEAVRKHELRVVLSMLPPEGKLLEIGAGTGWQAQALESNGYDVSVIDLPSSEYREDRVRTVTEYDGKHIPFDDNTFDIVYSSNVLEHIPHIHEFQEEIHRVLKPDGSVLHVLPSASWRIWTILAYLLKHFSIPKAHGEHANNVFTEICYFRRGWWRRLFRETGWVVETQGTNKLFYTGCSIMDSRLSIHARSRLAVILGGACNIFVLRKGSASS